MRNLIISAGKHFIVLAVRKERKWGGREKRHGAELAFLIQFPVKSFPANNFQSEGIWVTMCVFVRVFVCVRPPSFVSPSGLQHFFYLFLVCFFPPSYFSELVEPTLDLISFSNQPALGAMDYGLPCAFPFNTKRIIQKYRKSSNT